MTSRPPKAVEAIVFDLDGTLIDSAPDIAAAVNRVMGDKGHGALSVEYVEGFIGDGSRSMLRRIFTDCGIAWDDGSLEAALADYMRYYGEAPAERTRFFPNVREDLHRLYAAGYKLGVCTNKPHGLTEAVLSALGIDGLFAAVLGADAVPSRKPDKDHLLLVLERLGVSPSATFYVGDSQIDRACAHAAGVRFFLVSWGGGRFMDDGEDTRIARLADLMHPDAEALTGS